MLASLDHEREFAPCADWLFLLVCTLRVFLITTQCNTLLISRKDMRNIVVWLKIAVQLTTFCFVQTFAPPDYLAHLPACDMKFGGSAALQVSAQCSCTCECRLKRIKLAAPNQHVQSDKCYRLLLPLLLREQKEYERVRHGRKSAPALDIKR